MNVLISKEKLIEEYVKKEKSMHQIAKEQGISVGAVYNYTKRYGIESRHKLTKGAREKISKANKGNSYAKGAIRSEETRRKMSEAKKGIFLKPSKYGGHVKQKKDGYKKVYVPEHPNATKDGYVMEHTLVVEESIGRYLREDEVVHHINKIRNDNRIENLKLMTTSEHCSFHMKERWMQKKGVMTYQ